jgi:hypothetical protein
MTLLRRTTLPLLALSTLLGAPLAGAQLPQPVKVVEILSTNNGLCLDLAGGVSAGRNLLTWSCHGEDNQHLRLKGGKLLVGASGTFAIGARGKGQPVVSEPVQDSRSNWTWTENRQLKLSGTNLCLDIEGEKREPGARLILWDCKTGFWQGWSGWNQRFIAGSTTDRIAPGSKPILPTKPVTDELTECIKRGGCQFPPYIPTQNRGRYVILKVR